MVEELQTVRIIPSPFERQFDKLAAKFIPFIPIWVTPNHITFLGFIFGIIAATFYYLASFHKALLLFAAICIFLHLLADSLDGSTARERNLTSRRGEFLDKIIDALFFLALPIGIGLSSYAHFEIMIFCAILPLLHDVLLLLWVLMKKKWLFP